MAIAIPTEVPTLLFPSIEAATEQLEGKALSCVDTWAQLAADRKMQEDFLASFSSTFNISISLARSGAKTHQLARWRSTELQFAKDFNDIHAEWKGRLITSAMTRAVGHLSKCDPQHPTKSGYREDAAGTPIYEGADSRLTLRLLEAHFPEVYSQQITLNQSPNVLLASIADDATGEEAADAYALVMGGQ